jgi:hypothetical protein
MYLHIYATIISFRDINMTDRRIEARCELHIY